MPNNIFDDDDDTDTRYEPAAGGDDSLFPELLDLLRGHGISLPESTTPRTLVRRLHCALTALRGHRESPGALRRLRQQSGIEMSTVGRGQADAAWIRARAAAASWPAPDAGVTRRRRGA
jgi:hypothetical protein